MTSSQNVDTGELKKEGVLGLHLDRQSRQFTGSTSLRLTRREKVATGRVLLFEKQIHVERKSHKKKTAIPLELTWISKLSSIEDQFLLIGPEDEVLLHCKNKKEKEEWIKAILTQIEYVLQQPPTKTRSGEYTFFGGHYEGQWKKGQCDGQGRFDSSIDRTVYEGLWLGIFGAGYGSITKRIQDQEKTYEGGWISDLPSGGVKEPEDNKIVNHNNRLTESDWQLLLSGATLLSYNKGQAIMTEGQYAGFVYKIKSGTCTREKEFYGQTIVLEVVENNFFGELSMLDKHIASYTVMVISDKAEVWSINLPYVYG